MMSFAAIQFLDKNQLDIGVRDDVIIDVAAKFAGGFGEVMSALYTRQFVSAFPLSLNPLLLSS